ncbi:hypothetical protein [Roseibium aggregatum]|uniref:Uncharacterized protein n=1 Tax=Roseibium aggregatum TaxID=187304 RepID=A0A939EBI8_9HYPH|nr:hypothetical protein [Roseibium aggregatum]MBN9669053.1 hypothetical protein [Roseibium aggregatum]
MSRDPFAGQAARLIETRNTGGAEPAGSEIWQKAAEDCVLARISCLRLVGGLPLHAPPLSRETRLKRLRMLLQLWANGCICAVDEELFADVVNRRKGDA